jgi:hypothetical protein
MMKIRRLIFLPILAAFFLLSAIMPCASVSAAATMALTATPNSTENYIALSWSNSDRSQPYSYMLYSKSSVESSFQSIPSKSTVKVLNVYPDNTTGSWAVSGTVSFTSAIDGKSYTFPKSASLKMWMETPNPDSPNGYGKGLISVDAVPLSAFNANPNSFLKNSDGSYKYDTVFFGSWDGNSNEDLTTASEPYVEAFVNTGRGLLIGHDTASCAPEFMHTVFGKLAEKYANMYVLGGLGQFPAIGYNQVTIKKKGLLTSYPWAIGNVGTILNTPMSHTYGQFAMGDIWMTYPQNSWSTASEMTTYNGRSGTNNFYLTTWSNCAMIQTGHSDDQATPDEQKVLANTLFYLSQITTDTSWDDHKGQDLAAPSAPAVLGVDLTATQGTVHFTAQDNAMGYQYYVEATGQNDNQKYDSPVVSTSIESGLKGYSIVIDTSPTTVPNGSITTTASSYTFSRLTGSGFYIHIAAVDNAGNVSSVTHYLVQNIISVTHPVSVSYSINPNSGTVFSAPDIPITNNSDMPINVTVQSLRSVSGGSLTFTDVDPTAKSWNTLNLADSKRYIALGVRARDANGWNSGYNTGTFWSVSTAPMLVGALNPSAMGNLTLTADSGLAFDSAYTAAHSLSFLFQLQ